MFKVEALVKPLALDELLEVLIPIGVHSLSYSEIYAVNKTLLCSPGEEPVQKKDVSFTPHIKLEMIVDRGHLEAIEEALAKKVSTPMIGGAEVTVMRVKEGLRVLAGNEGDPEIESL